MDNELTSKEAYVGFDDDARQEIEKAFNKLRAETAKNGCWKKAKKN